MSCHRRARALLRGLRSFVGCCRSWPAYCRPEAGSGTSSRYEEQSAESATLWHSADQVAADVILEAQLVQVRAPRPEEAVVVSGPGLAIGLRAMLKGNADLDTPGLHATLDRLDAIWEPIATHVGPHLALFGPEGPLPDGLEWCLPDTGIALAVPNVEGIRVYLDHAGIVNPHVVVSRRFLELIEDPGSSWPWDDKECLTLTTKLGLDTCL